MKTYFLEEPRGHAITKGTKCPDCKGRGFSDGLQPDSYWTCPTCAGTGDAPRVTALPLTPRKEALC